MELPYASLHQLCAPFLDELDDLPAPQREALRVALGMAARRSARPLPGRPRRPLVSATLPDLLRAGKDWKMPVRLVEGASDRLPLVLTGVGTARPGGCPAARRRARQAFKPALGARAERSTALL